jgi:hypothetical protein
MLAWIIVCAFLGYGQLFQTLGFADESFPAVFATMLETGRVEILCDLNAPLASSNCTFVIVNLNLDFLSEINWPGRVDIGTRVFKV